MRLLALALALAASAALTSCGIRVSCTEMGCDSGLHLDIEGLSPTGNGVFSVSGDLDGLTFDVTCGDAANETRTDLRVECRPGGVVLNRLEGTQTIAAAVVNVRVTEPGSDRTASAELRPVYRLNFVNGEACDESPCHNAEERVTLAAP